MGYSSRTISKALDQLCGFGFIEIAELGCGTEHRSHKIALTNNWKDYDTEDFKPCKGKSDGPTNGGFKRFKIG